MNDRANNPFDLISQEIGISLPSTIGFGVQHPYGFTRAPNVVPMDMIPDLPPMPMPHNGGIHQIIHGSVPKRGKSGQTRKGDMERIEKRRKREREAAARSRQRKMELINTLEAKVAMMKDEIQQLKLQVIRLGGVPETGTAGLDFNNADMKKIKTIHIQEDADQQMSSSNSSPISQAKSRK